MANKLEELYKLGKVAESAYKEAKGAKKASEVLIPNEGKILMLTQADRTKVGGNYLGGPGFSGIQLNDPKYAGAAWGVKSPSVAQTIIGGNMRVPKGQAVWTTMIGDPAQHKSNQHVFDSLHKEFKDAAKEGKLDPQLHAEINNRLASAVDKNGNNIFPENVDILSKDFKKQANTFDRRAIAADLMGGKGVGGKKGQIFDYDKSILETTDPVLIGEPTGALGNRLFTLDNEFSDRPDLHSAFPTILHGEDLGETFHPAARDVLMEDWIKNFREQKGREPGYYDWTRGYAPHQQIDEATIRRLQEAGFAKGGKVGKAAGILSEIQKAYDEAKALETVKAAAPTIIVPQRGKIKDIMENVRNQRGNYAARRVERAADEVPNLEHQYTQNALEREFTASNPQALMVMNPKDFEQYAHPLSSALTERTSNYGKFDTPAEMGYEEYIDYLANIARDSGLSDVPYLRINETPEGELIIGGHEGRHRTRALSKLGDESTLIALDPSYSLTSDDARRYKEDYVNALNARFGPSRLITPEYRPQVDDAKRSPIIMPEIFKDGGKVDLEQEFVKADSFAKGGWNSPNAPKEPQSPTQPMSLPDLDTLALTGKILAKNARKQFKKEWANPSPQAVRDVVGNIGAGIVGMPSDIIESARGTPMPSYQPYKGVDLERERKGIPMLGSENIKKQLKDTGITSGTERPLTENLAMFAVPYLGEMKGANVGLSIKDVSDAKKAVGFTSTLAKTVNNHKMETMPGPQWSAWINANASKGAKKEAEATGLHEWLKTQPKVTKYDIEEHIGENLPKIKVIEKGAPLKLTADEQQELTDLGGKLSHSWHGVGDPLTEDELARVIYLQNVEEKATPGSLRAQAIDWERQARKSQQVGNDLAAKTSYDRAEHYKNRADELELNPIQYGGGKWSSYTEPGGTNYQEIMLSLPRKHVPEYTYNVHGYSPKQGFATREEAQAYADEQNNLPNELREKLKDIDPSSQAAMERVIGNMEKYPHQVLETESPISRSKNPDFIVPRAHIYDDPETDYNRLAHLRTKERPTADKKRALFLEELQSDWAQQGRDQGFRQDLQKLTEAEERRFQELLLDGRRNLEGDNLAEFESLMAKRDAYASNPSIPSGPYVTDTKDWTALGLKHALKKAVDEGHDYIAWTTGDQQAKRYDLSKQVSKINYTDDGLLQAYDLDGELVLNQKINDPKELTDYVGKDVAKKLMEQEPTMIRAKVNQYGAPIAHGNVNNFSGKQLVGEDLNIGGEGMKGYYDQIVPQTMNDVLKQIGASERVKPIPVRMGEAPPYEVTNRKEWPSGQISLNLDGSDRLFQNAEHESEFLKSLDDSVPHMGIEITPELRELILNEGLPHFHEGGDVETAKKSKLYNRTTKYDKLALESEFKLADIIDPKK